MVRSGRRGRSSPIGPNWRVPLTIGVPTFSALPGFADTEDMTGATAAIDVETELVGASRERVVSPLSRRERLTHGATAAFFAVAASLLVAAAPRLWTTSRGCC